MNPLEKLKRQRRKAHTDIPVTDVESLVAKFFKSDTTLPGHIDLFKAVLRKFGSAEQFADILYRIISDDDVSARDRAKILLFILTASRDVEAQRRAEEADETAMSDEDLELALGVGVSVANKMGILAEDDEVEDVHS